MLLEMDTTSIIGEFLWEIAVYNDATIAPINFGFMFRWESSLKRPPNIEYVFLENKGVFNSFEILQMGISFFHQMAGGAEFTSTIIPRGERISRFFF